MPWFDRSGAGVLARGAAAVLSAAAWLALISLFRTPDLSWLPALLAIGGAAAAVVRPWPVLLTVAALMPSIAWAGARLHYYVSWPEVLAIAFLAGWGLHVTIRGTRARLGAVTGPAALLFAALVTASMVLDVTVLTARIGFADAVGTIRHYFVDYYFLNASEQPGLHAGRLLLEGLGLLWGTTTLAAGNPSRRRQLAGAIAGGAAGASAIAIAELARSATRADAFFSTFMNLLATVRHAAGLSDLNAAGSMFVLAIFLAAALAAGREARARAWIFPGALIAAGLWLTASRAALFAVPVALGIGLAALFVRGRQRARQAALLIAVLLVGGIAMLQYAPQRGNQAASSVAAQVRLELARTSLRITQQAPVFGVGVGQYPAYSGQFASPALIALFPVATQENAHNQFFQVLAELGMTGLAAFVAILAGALAPAIRYRLDEDRIAIGTLTGLTAFLITCLAGHPLLVPTVAFVFWIALGLAAASGPVEAGVPAARSRSLARAALVAALLGGIAVSLPSRATARVRNADFEHLGIGVSVWHTAEDGVRYRELTGTGAIFVPNGKGFRFQMRADSPDPVDVELRLAGRLANVVRLHPGQWTDVVMTLQDDPSRGRFLRLDIVAPPGTVIWTTKVEG